MTTRADLLADVLDWSGHAFTTTRQNSILRVAEANIGRDVRINAMLTTDGAFSISAATETAPTGILEVKRFRLSGTQNYLSYRAPNAFYDDVRYDQTGTPEIFTIEGGNFVFAPAPTSTFTGLLSYLKRFEALTADADTNDLLIYNYDIYLFACLAAAFSFAEDDEQAKKYMALYSSAKDKLNTSDQFTTHQMNSMRRG